MDYNAANARRQQILADNDPVTAAVVLGQMLANDPDFYDALHGRELAPGIHVQNPGPDASMMTERYLEGVGNAAARYVQGMQNPRRDPVQAAIRAAGKYKNRVIEAANEGRYEAGVRTQNYAEGVQAATSDGGQAYVSGAQRRAPKVGRAMQRLAPLLGGVSQAIQAMPQDTDQQREARLLQARRAMIAVGKQYRGGRVG
jgi:hypothetical protein